MNAKKRVLTSFDKISPEIRKVLESKYPDGYLDHAVKVDAPTPFYAVILELDDIIYLIKVNKKVKIGGAEDEEDDNVDMDDEDNNENELVVDESEEEED